MAIICPAIVLMCTQPHFGVDRGTKFSSRVIFGNFCHNSQYDYFILILKTSGAIGPAAQQVYLIESLSNAVIAYLLFFACECSVRATSRQTRPEPEQDVSQTTHLRRSR